MVTTTVSLVDLSGNPTDGSIDCTIRVVHSGLDIGLATKNSDQAMTNDLTVNVPSGSTPAQIDAFVLVAIQAQLAQWGITVNSLVSMISGQQTAVSAQITPLK